MTFTPILVGALYPGITRGLDADHLATQALGGRGLLVCTCHVVAGRGVVTDVLNVPTDTVSAQLEHLAETESPTAAKVGIIGDAPTVEVAFRRLRDLEGPVMLDLTLSGPSGEDVLGQRGLDALLEHLDVPDLVTVRKQDAALLAGMEIPSLDDAQVAVQRIGQRGASHVLLRCGRLPTHHFDTDSSPPDYAVDLYYDGDDIALFEAPFLSGLESMNGASSGLTIPLLQMMQDGVPVEQALQKAKGQVTEALRAAQQATGPHRTTAFFDALQPHTALPAPEVEETDDDSGN
jgi:hydroxymethylpyrimidine kinase/phosphomethylpyrimidine kinase